MPEIQLGDLRLDAPRQRAARLDREILLTSREYCLLELLARNEGQVLSFRSLGEGVARKERDAVGTLQLDIETLQEKVNGPGEPALIFAVGTIGYALHAAQ